MLISLRNNRTAYVNRPNGWGVKTLFELNVETNTYILLIDGKLHRLQAIDQH